MKKRLSAMLLVLTLVSGCASVESVMPDWSDLNPFSEDENSVEEKKVVNPMVLAVNPYLWQASLDKLSFMPLVSADSKGGVIITDWKSMQGAANEQFKVTVTIHTRELRADGLKAEVFERELSNGVWVDKKANPKLADELEKAILYRARDLFRRDVISR